MSQDAQISMPVAKASAAIASAGVAQLLESGHQAGASIFADLFVLTVANLASWAAFILTMSMLFHFYWTKVWRPLFEIWGWIKPKSRRVYTAREWAEKMAEQDSTRVPLE